MVMTCSIVARKAPQIFSSRTSGEGKPLSSLASRALEGALRKDGCFVCYDKYVMKILLTGEPGVGKSTILSSAVDVFEQKQGFLTTEVRIENVRTGFTMTASNGESFELCSVDSTSDIRVSRYGVNLQELDEFTNQLRKRDDIEVIEVTLENRDALKDELVSRLAQLFII